MLFQVDENCDLAAFAIGDKLHSSDEAIFPYGPPLHLRTLLVTKQMSSERSGKADASPVRLAAFVIGALRMAGKDAIDIPDWKTFEQKIDELRAEYGGRVTSPLLYRGQANSEWPLTTTLERSGQGPMLFREFYELITARIGPAVETFTGVAVPEYDPMFAISLSDPELLTPGVREFPPQPLYRYMVYLRHYGFPSPLLDWSYSPYVAAFFAFRDDPSAGPAKRSIYVYCESPHGIRGGAVGEPTIKRIGPYVRSHRRHFRQQSDYTICGSLDPNYGWRYDSHQNVFEHRRPKQNFLWKLDVPSGLRVEILEQLNDYNLNAFSLFDSEESLLETMWVKEQVLKTGKL
jgi:hypothetical protein